MGLFTRRAHAAQHPDGPATTQPATTTRTQRRNRQPYNYSMATRPSFGQWLKYTWLDIVTMAAMGAIGLGVSHQLQPKYKVQND